MTGCFGVRAWQAALYMICSTEARRIVDHDQAGAELPDADPRDFARSRVGGEVAR